MTRPRRPERAGTPLRGRYLVHHPLWNAWLRAADLVLDRVVRSPVASSAATFRRVLVGIGGHLGDAVIATSFITRLREITGAEVGVVTGRWNHQVLQGHPAIRWLHGVDHWKLNRAPLSLPRRVLESRRTAARALADIRAVGYDAAVDLSSHYPNFAPLLWRAGIPVRVGFTSGGYGGFYTHPVQWRPGRHVAIDHLRLLGAIADAPETDLATLRYALPEVPADVRATAEHRLRERGVAGEYVVVHMGAGASHKEWTDAGWQAVVRQLATTGMSVVFTGNAGRQRETADTVARNAANARTVNLCGELTWLEFRAVIRAARVVASVDTVAMHVAAAEGTPTVSLVTGIDDPVRWHPLTDRRAMLMQSVPCAPCYLSTGCADMACVRGLTPTVVVQAIEQHLR